MTLSASNHTPDSLQQQLQKIDWSRFETAYADATVVPSQLIRLFFSEHDDAMDAAHELWCGLCHQHAYVSSAALPALPFLFLALDSLDPKRAAEVLDILYGFAVCTGEDTLEGWQRQLRQALSAESVRFEALKHHKDEDISDWGHMICEALAIRQVAE